MEAQSIGSVAERLLPEIRSTPSPRPPEASLARTDPTREIEVAKIVLEVELTKQLKPPLSQQQRTQLVVDLCKTGAAVETIRRWGESVKLKETFGTIELRHWVSELLCLRSDLQRHVTEEIRRRKAALESMEVDIDAAERAAYDELSSVYYQRFEAQKERARLDLARRVRECRGWIAKLSLEERSRLIGEAVERGVFREYDEHLVQHALTPHVALKLLPIIEERLKQLTKAV